MHATLRRRISQSAICSIHARKRGAICGTPLAVATSARSSASVRAASAATVGRKAVSMPSLCQCRAGFVPNIGVLRSGAAQTPRAPK